jgi:hypothetical protein
MITITINDCIRCAVFPCVDVDQARCLFPDLEIDPTKIIVIVISEVAPPDPPDHYYAIKPANMLPLEEQLFQFNQEIIK